MIHHSTRFTLAHGSGVIQLWDIEKQKVLATLERKDGGDNFAFSTDGKTLAWTTSSGVSLWNVATRKEQMRLKGQEAGASSVAFSPDGTIVVSGGDGVVYGWETKTTGGAPFLILKGHANSVDALAITACNKLLASADREKNVKIWDLGTGKELRTFRGKHFALTPDGKHLIIYESFHGTFTIWDVATGAKRTEIKTTSCHDHMITMSPDGTSLAIGCDNGNVLVWDVKSLLEANK